MYCVRVPGAAKSPIFAPSVCMDCAAAEGLGLIGGRTSSSEEEYETDDDAEVVTEDNPGFYDEPVGSDEEPEQDQLRSPELQEAVSRAASARAAGGAGVANGGAGRAATDRDADGAGGGDAGDVDGTGEDELDEELSDDEVPVKDGDEEAVHIEWPEGAAAGETLMVELELQDGTSRQIPVTLPQIVTATVRVTVSDAAPETEGTGRAARRVHSVAHEDLERLVYIHLDVEAGGPDCGLTQISAVCDLPGAPQRAPITDIYILAIRRCVASSAPRGAGRAPRAWPRSSGRVWGHPGAPAHLAWAVANRQGPAATPLRAPIPGAAWASQQ